ncbi:aminoglycoside phosphotransferase family protein [Streptomyces iconiensis]|uniref:Aminoglycoside phosphotransferase family protein n=1 Tax=Streptomyces iconiensis TaxID=1384038 RepID=A0ABT7A511_9ACTN|nr:aminoglycoside phosphotransferase family protein [Streptomyces iconiensis]MDJ1136104.1 aminoglycoside phosphotransferase family protein [Streptomyces iconiensis]
MIELPEAFVRTTVDREGEPGATWLAQLPGILEELLERWSCVPDGGVLHGDVGVIVPVRRRDGTTAVLKVSFPHPGNVHEPDAFAVWGGRGAVLLYERDDDRFAMLLERARTSTLAEAGEPGLGGAGTGPGDDGSGGGGRHAQDDRVACVAGRINHRLAVPAPPGLPRLRERADAWEEQLLRDAEELAHGLSRQAVDAALATVSELGRVQPDTLVHGDLHPGNILRADREPWLAVDPKGYAGDPAYDGGTLLKSRALVLLEADNLRKALHRTLDVFAEAAGLDRERVRRWAQFHAVDTALWARRHGFRMGRGESWLERGTAFADRAAGLLAERS